MNLEKINLKEMSKKIYKEMTIEEIKKELANYDIEFDFKVSKMNLSKVLAEKIILK